MRSAILAQCTEGKPCIWPEGREESWEYMGVQTEFGPMRVFHFERDEPQGGGVVAHVHIYWIVNAEAFARMERGKLEPGEWWVQPRTAVRISGDWVSGSPVELRGRPRPPKGDGQREHDTYADEYPDITAPDCGPSGFSECIGAVQAMPLACRKVWCDKLHKTFPGDDEPDPFKDWDRYVLYVEMKARCYGIGFLDPDELLVYYTHSDSCARRDPSALSPGDVQPEAP